MEIVKYVKVTVGLAAPKSAKKQTVAHINRKNTGASAFGGLALQALQQTSPMLGKRHKTGGALW